MSIVGSKSKTTWFDVVNIFLMVMLSIISIFPFYYVVIVSLANYEEISKQLIYIIPRTIDISAYKMVIGEKFFMNSFLVSTFVTVVGAVSGVLLSAAAGYTLSKKSVPGQKAMFIYILIPMFFGGGLVPTYLNIRDLHLINKLGVLILPCLVGSFSLILLKSFFEDLPASIEESAKIDGANDIYILIKIVLPTSAPVIATIGLFYAVDKWNDYYSALLFISERKLYPLQLVLREMIMDFSQAMASNIGVQIARQNSTVFPTGIKMAIIVISTIPIFCVYPFLQKHFTKGIMFGAIKG